MNKKIFILLAFFLYSFSLYGLIVEDFEHFSISQVSSTGISNVFLSSYYYSSLGYSLSVERNIGVYKECPSAADWSVANELIITPTGKNWSGNKYFGIWIKDIANLEGTGASSYQISFNDGDEEWIHEVGFSDDSWHHIIVYLKDTGWGTAYWDSCSSSTQYSSDTKGFSLPKWEINDAYYVGNGNLDLNNVQKIKVAFGNASPIRGECLIDNIRVFNETKSSAPFFQNGYITYLSKAPDNIKFNFVEDMNSGTVSSSFDIYTNNGVFGDSTVYDSSANQATITPSSGFETNVLYKVVMNTNLKFADNTPIIENVTNLFIIQTNIALGYISGVLPFDNGLTMIFSDESFSKDYNFKAYVTEPGLIPGTSVKSVLEYKLLPVLKAQKNILYIIDYSSSVIEDTKQLKVYYKEGDRYTEINSELDTENKVIRFETDKVGDFVVGEVVSPIKLQNNLLKITSIDNKIFQPRKNQTVTLHWTIGEGVSKIKGKIFNTSGIVVKNFELPLSENKTEMTWDGSNGIGNSLPSGIYIIELTVYAGNDDVEEFYSWNENKGQSQTVKIPVVIY